MSIHRYTVAVGVAGLLFGLGMTHSHAQVELIRAQVDVVDSAIGPRVATAQLRRAIGEMP
jgi:hypothetical protein